MPSFRTFSRPCPSVRQALVLPGKALAALVLGMLCLWSFPGLLHAEPVGTEYYSVELPDNWEKLQTVDLGTTSIIVFATKSRDCIVTAIAGDNGGSSLATITQCFAQQYKSPRKPSVDSRQGSFVFDDSEGTDSQAYVTVQDNAYLVITLNGNLRQGRNFVKKFSSEKYAKLLPRL